MTELREQLEAAVKEYSAQETGGAANDNAEPGPVLDGGDSVAPNGVPEVDGAAAHSGDGGSDGKSSHGVPRVRDAHGRFAPKAATNGSTNGTPDLAPQVPPEAPKPAPGVNGKAPLEQPIQSTAQPPAEAPRAPQSWKPQAREHWAKLPAEIQAEVVKREREIATALQESAEPRKFYQQMREVLAPHEQMLRATGLDPVRAVNNLMQFQHAMHTAPVEQKGVLVANMMRAFGITEEAVASALQGQPANGNTPAYVPPPQPAFDPQALKAEIQAELRQQFEVDQFRASHEFFEDVRETMGKLVTAGLASTLEDAYNKAVQLHPDVAATIQQRQPPPSRAGIANQATIQRSKAAASSIRPQPAAAPTAQPTGLREQLEAAIAAANGR